MNYPQNIPSMSKCPTWDHEELFQSANGLEFTKSYYHRTNSTIDMHNHKFYEINIIVEGNGRHYIENNSCEALPGTVFIIPPGIRHGYYAGRHLNIFHTIVSYPFIERFSRELDELPGYSLLFEIEPVLRGEYDNNLFLKLSEKELEDLTTLFSKLCSLEVSTYDGRYVLKNAMVLELIGTLSQKISKQIQRPSTLHKNPYSAAIIRSMEYIRAHYGEKITFQTLAKELNMSYSTFLRHFESICGMSPGQYLNRCRVEKACEMLIHTEKNILDIALECGYFDSSHFIRSFFGFNKMSPLAYRKLKKDNEQEQP